MIKNDKEKVEIYEKKVNIQKIDIANYLEFIFKSVYFVVIETHAGLSKTIKIFNTKYRDRNRIWRSLYRK